MIIDQEKQISYWQHLNFAMNNPEVRSVWVVSDETGDGDVIEYIGQTAVEHAIWNGIHHKRFR